MALFFCVTAIALPVHPAASVVDELLARYQAAGAQEPDTARGGQLWQQKHGDRSCTTCHGMDLKQPGKHQRTGKTIQPMAPSVNPQRLTKARKVEKWFLRNCKWTLGRECSAQEKANILVWLSTR
jgi:hypothetical protein